MKETYKNKSASKDFGFGLYFGSLAIMWSTEDGFDVVNDFSGPWWFGLLVGVA